MRNFNSISLLTSISYYFRRALNRLISDHFPMKSTEFAVKSPKYNDYIAALDKVLALNTSYLITTSASQLSI